MGTLIKLAGADFSGANLPQVGFAYTGLKDGLLAAHHFNNSLLFSKDLSGNESELVQNGQVLFTDKYARMGDGKNGFVSLAADLATAQGKEFTICTIARQVVDSSEYSFPLSSFNGSVGTNIQIKTGGIRPQLHTAAAGGGSLNTTFSGDEVTSDNLKFEAGFITCSTDNLEAIWYHPKYNWKRVRAFSGIPQHQPNFAGLGSRWLVGFSDSALNTQNDICYVAIFDRALTELEIQQQYDSMKKYAADLGIGEI